MRDGRNEHGTLDLGRDQMSMMLAVSKAFTEIGASVNSYSTGIFYPIF